MTTETKQVKAIASLLSQINDLVTGFSLSVVYHPDSDTCHVDAIVDRYVEWTFYDSFSHSDMACFLVGYLSSLQTPYSLDLGVQEAVTAPNLDLTDVYRKALYDAVSLEDWISATEKTLAMARGGKPLAWLALARYLIGPPAEPIDLTGNDIVYKSPP